MSERIIKATQYICDVCGHQWLSKGGNPMTPPRSEKARTASIQVGRTFPGQRFFVYANGTPGDLDVSIQDVELATWREIVLRVNLVPRLVEALKANHDFIDCSKKMGEGDCDDCELIRQAEGK